MKYLLLFLLAILISCSKKESQVNSSLIGTWNRNDGIINSYSSYLSIDDNYITKFSHSNFSTDLEIIGYNQIGNDYPYEITLTCKKKRYYEPRIVELKLRLKSEDSLYYSGLWYVKL